MKKIAILLCSILLTLPMICSNTYATSSGSVIYDSVNIPDNELAAVKDNETDIVIKIYNGFYLPGFDQRATIEELLSDKYVLKEEYMVFYNPYSVNYKIIEDGVVGRIYSHFTSFYEDVIYEYALSYESLFSSVEATKLLRDLSVSEIYVLDGAPSVDALYIYFVTNHGDYVYYNNLTDQYLMPIELFYDFVETMQKNRDPYADGGNVENIEDIIDLSNYKVINTNQEQNDQLNNNTENNNQPDNVNDFNLLWIISLTVALIVAIILIYCKKRKLF